MTGLKVVILRGVALVEERDVHGKLIVRRYTIPKIVRKRIKHFDGTGEWPDGWKAYLLPPSECETLEGRKKQKEIESTRRKNGQFTPAKRPTEQDNTRRSGSGLRFNTAVPE
jgi:hypothetical protein